PALARPSPTRLARSLDHDLLTATLGEGDSARTAWHAWLAKSSIESSAFSLLQIGPMLYENLRRAGGTEGVRVGTIRGIHRRAWYDNQLRTRDASAALRCLHHGGIDPLVLGDLTSAVAAAERGAVRPIRTIDLCVDPSEAIRAVALLEDQGWRPPHALTADAGKGATSTRLRAATHQVLDLHWRPLPARAAALP